MTESISHTNPETAESPSVPRGPQHKHVAASYARKSDPNEEGVKDQHLSNAERALRDGFEIPLEHRWSDDGVSGTTTKRSGLSGLLALIESGKAGFTRLYVRDRDRLARTADPRFAFYLEFLCKANGVQMCYTTDKRHIEYGDGGDEGMVDFITAALKNMKAHQELADTRKRTTRGTRKGLKKGHFVTTIAPYGYDRWLARDDNGAFEQLVPRGLRTRMTDHHFRLRANAAEQVALAQLFDGIRQRKSYAQIARELEASGAPRPRTKPWSAKHVREIARNPMHKGDYIFGWRKYPGVPVPAKELNAEEPTTAPVVLPGFIPEAPLTAVEWERIQAVINERVALARRQKPKGSRYLLTSILRCSLCNTAVYGHRQATRRGDRVRMYRHPITSSRYADAPCPHEHRYVHAEPLEAAALEATRVLLSSEEAQELARAELQRLKQNVGAVHHATALREAESALGTVKRAATEANARAARAVTDMERQIHGDTMLQFAAEAQALTQRVEALRSDAVRIAEAEGRLPAMEARLAELRASFDHCSPDERKVIVATVIESVRVDFAAHHAEIRVRAA